MDKYKSKLKKSMQNMQISISIQESKHPFQNIMNKKYKEGLLQTGRDTGHKKKYLKEITV